MFDKISEKISQTAGIVKINGLIAQEERQINDYLLQIGEICYNKFPENPESLVANLVAQINGAKAKIAEYAEQVNKLKGVAKCEQCGMDIVLGNKFCSGCGTRVKDEAINTAEEGPVCMGCGASLASDVAFCTGCGQKVSP